MEAKEANKVLPHYIRSSGGEGGLGKRNVPRREVRWFLFSEQTFQKNAKDTPLA